MRIHGGELTNGQAAELDEIAADLMGEGIEGGEAEELAEAMFILSHRLAGGRWVPLEEE